MPTAQLGQFLAPVPSDVESHAGIGDECLICTTLPVSPPAYRLGQHSHCLWCAYYCLPGKVGNSCIAPQRGGTGRWAKRHETSTKGAGWISSRAYNYFRQSDSLW